MFKLKNQIQLYLTTLCLVSTMINAQFYDLPNDFIYNRITEKKLAELDSASVTHASIQPFIPFFNLNYQYLGDTFRLFKFIKDDPAIEKIFYDDLIHIRDKKKNTFDIKLNPLIDFEWGRAGYDTTNNQKVSVNTRGFIASGRLGKDVYFETLLSENQATFPGYVTHVNKQTLVVPGQGRWKSFKSNGFDYAFSSGFVSYQPLKKLNIQLGHGKQKIGNGYRSLLLSDNAFNYPYVRITTQFWKNRIQYTNIYAVLMNMTTGGAPTPPNTEALFQKKAASFQYVNIQITKRAQVGFFQGMIWQAADSSNRQHLSWQYFNPVIYTNLAYYGLNNKNNILVGANLNLKITNRISIYGQFMGDDFSNTKKTGNAWGYQIGAKYFDAFKIPNLSFQIEYDDVKEGSYNSPITAYSNQSYSHYNQGLAYTIGYGKELIGVVDYKYKRMFVNLKSNYQNVPFNGNTFYNNMILQSRVGFTINTAYNLNIFVSYTYRKQNFSTLPLMFNNLTQVFSFGIKTSLYNTYYDF